MSRSSSLPSSATRYPFLALFRQPNKKASSHSWLRFEGNFASMRFHARFRARQAKTRSGPFLVGHERLEYLAAKFFRDPRPRVDNRDKQTTIASLEFQPQLASVTHRFPRVLNHVRQTSGYPHFIDPERLLGPVFDLNRNGRTPDLL